MGEGERQGESKGTELVSAVEGEQRVMRLRVGLRREKQEWKERSGRKKEARVAEGRV